jgi:hypothetical protein
MTAAFNSQIGDQGDLNGGYTGGDGGPQGEGGQGNPAWQPFLEAVPQELHQKITPLLQDWDKGVNDRFQKVHSEYEPWKPIIGAAGDPQTAQFALNLLDAMYNNPQAIYDALKSKYNFDGSEANESQQNQGNGNGQGQGGPTQEPWESRYNQLQQQNAQIAEYLLNQKQAELAAQQDHALEQELSAAKAKHGEFDERYVLALMQSGASAEQAVQQFHQFREETAKNYTPKPLIMGGGGSYPGGNFNPAKASDGQVSDLVVQMLQANAAERKR